MAATRPAVQARRRRSNEEDHHADAVRLVRRPGRRSPFQNFASNLAGIVTTTFTDVMLTITSGSFIVPLVVAGGFCLLGAAADLFMVGEIAPLPPLLDGSATHRANAAE